ncbi:hypothetical protein U0070_017743 [Myodes glareolus]|uniref:Uncharacterized protein n=1 Tax=Myodes glareolus TaxID=447135 RepID=A0AAW0HTI4_MYOGA
MFKALRGSLEECRFLDLLPWTSTAGSLGRMMSVKSSDLSCSVLQHHSRPLDHISFELFDDDALKTAEDFHALGTGKKGFD